MVEKVYAVGDIGTYIYDIKASVRLCEIPAIAAFNWVAAACPAVSLDGCSNGKTAKDSLNLPETTRLASGWLNKLWIVVAEDYHGSIALYNHDGKFYVYRLPA